MTEDDVRALIARLRIEVKTTSNYTGGWDGEPLYTDSHTIQLLIDDEVISEAYL